MSKIFNFLFQNKSVKQTVAKNTFWLFVGQSIGRLSRASVVIYAARLLGAANWGVFSYALSITTLLSIFTDLGINAILTKETARLDPESAHKTRRQIISTAFFIKLVMIALSLFILIFIAPAFTNIKEAIALYPIMAFILIFDNLREFGFAITRSLEKMELEAGFFIITNVSVALAGFWLLKINPISAYLAYGYVLGTGIGLIMTFIYLRNYFKGLWKNFSRKLIKPIFSSAWPFAMLGIMGSVMINTDMIILGWFRSAAELGFYSVAQKPVQLLYVLPTLIATSLFPTLSRLAHVDNQRTAELINKVLKLVLLVALPIAVVGIIFGTQLITLFFGQEYLPAVLTWQILLLTLIIIFPGTIIGNAIFAYDQQKLFIQVLVIGAVSNIVLDLLFIPRWGGPGSAVATVIAQLVSNLFLWHHLKKINPLIKIL